MNRSINASTTTTTLMLRLLPVQVMLAAVSFVNGIVSSLFAGNFIGEDAMTAVQLFSPVQNLIYAVSLMLMSGSQILCGEYMGRNEREKTSEVFTLDLLIGIVFSALIVLIFLPGAFGRTGIFTDDPGLQKLLSMYITGQIVGVLPAVLGQQFTAFLSLEKQMKRNSVAAAVFIAVNLIMSYLFIVVMDMGILGLSLASSIGNLALMLIGLQYYLSGRSFMRFSRRGLKLRDCGEVIKVGAPGALSQGYQSIRGAIINTLVPVYVGASGLAAFAAANSLLTLFWAIPAGMVAVSRMLISVSIGEEDRKTLADIMRTVFRRYIPLMMAIDVVISLLAVPLTHLYFRDPSESVYMMTVWGFRLLPFVMPLSIILMHFVCYGQASGKQVLVHILSIVDGFIGVALFTYLLLPVMGINGLYIANILNGVLTTAIIVLYPVIVNKKFPRNMYELMVIPDDFGVSEEDRIDITVREANEAVSVSKDVQEFCLGKGIDERRAQMAGLCMEEMTVNVIEHGFTKDDKKHAVDMRVTYKNDDLIMRIRDDCIPFDPAERMKLSDPDDPGSNIGIRMAYSIAADIKYQNILGLNVLTMRI